MLMCNLFLIDTRAIVDSFSLKQEKIQKKSVKSGFSSSFSFDKAVFI